MYFIVGAIIAVIVLLIVGVFYVQMQDTKKRVEKQKALMEQTRQIQKEFKQQAQTLVDTTIINIQQKQKFCYLANNFFVFQSVNDIGVANLQKLTDYFSTIVDQAANLELTETLSDVFAMAANKVPSSAREFTSTFYLSNATKILTQLRNDIDSIIEGDLQEDEAPNDETNIESKDEQESEDNTPETDDDDGEHVDVIAEKAIV